VCWWISRRIRIEREHCCDDMAVGLCGDGVTYASALAELESYRRDAALAVAAVDGALLQRVRRVIAPAAPASASWAGALAPIVMMAVLVAGAQAAGRAAMADPGQTRTPSVGRLVPPGEAVLEGQVLDAASARPIAGAMVQAIGDSGSAQTRSGDDGRFEFRGLKPGAYTLSVKARGFVETYYGKRSQTIMDFGTQVTAPGGRVTSGLDFRLQAAGGISGRIIGPRGTGLAGVEVELVRELEPGRVVPAGGGFAQTLEDGTYRITEVSPGDYIVRAYTEHGRAATGPGTVYAPTFYPGVTDAGAAQRLRLYAGQELLDVDFELATSRLFVVRGRLIDPAGGVGGLGVILHPMAASGLPGGEVRVTVDATGAYEIRGVAPGRYMLNVMDPRRTMRWMSAMKMLTVDGDVLDLELRAQLGATIEGRVIRDAGITQTLDVSGVHVGFTRLIDGPTGGFTGNAFPAAADGTFSLEAPGGFARFDVKRLPPGWMVKSISLDGAEIDDVPMDFGTGRRHIDVVLTDRLTAVSGIVVDRNGQTLPNYSVVLFPPDASRWQGESRFVRASRSDNSGRFRIEGVPPGSYLAVAVAGLPMESWRNPEVLQRLRSSAETIRLLEGQQLTISIRAVPTPGDVAGRTPGLEMALFVGCANQGRRCGV
jgi:protocatechuate 3,4-dioxygenase beta subunit